MKRMLPLLLCLLLLWGCTAPPPATTAPPETTRPPETTQPTIPPETISPEILALRENLPRMDGSTSLIPLEAGIRAAIFDISLEDATDQVAHSSTWQSFYRLLDGETDLIFSTPLSEDQWEMAQNRGIALEAVPVAMEGFVFVVNAANPVDTLTRQQLKDIYSGVITNWNQLGGPDLPIIPYQRNHDSGSQNYMTAFMGDTPLMEAPVEMRPATMEGLMDVVAVNDNALGAIGYSVYAYAADMYGSGDEIKFIRVDGVAPDKQSMAAGEYPLLGQNYAVFRADTPESSGIRTLVNWVTSYDGQLAIAKAGYVTLEDIGFDYQEQKLSLWQGTGTGPAALEPDLYEWRGTQVRHEYWGDEYTEFLPLVIEDGLYRIDGLRDPELAAQVNAFIEAQTAWVPAAREELLDWIQLQSRDNSFASYSPDIPWSLTGYSDLEKLDYICIATAKNGLLSVAVSVCGSNNTVGSEYLPWRTETATWDLVTGKRLTMEELFCRGVDIAAVLNERVRSYSMNPTDSWGVYPEMKQDFAGLPLTGWHITHDAIYIDQDNPYFATAQRIPLTGLADGVLVTDQAQDFGDAFDHGDILVHKTWRVTDRDNRYSYNADGLVSCGFLKEEVHPNAAAINREVLDHLNTYFTRDAITDFYTAHGVDISDVEIWMLDWDLMNLGGRYLLFHGRSPYHMAQQPEEEVRYPHATALLYDLQSGRQIHWTALLREGWQENARNVRCELDWETYTAIPQDTAALELISMYPYADGTMDIRFRFQGLEYDAEIPWDYVNYE